MDMKMATVDTGDYYYGVRERETRAKKLPLSYYVHCLGHGIIHTPKLSITQCTHVTKLHVPPNLK